MGLLESLHQNPLDGPHAGGQLEEITEERPEWLGHAPAWIQKLWEQTKTNRERRLFFNEEFHWLKTVEEKAKKEGESFNTGTYLSDMIAYGLKKKLITPHRAEILTEHIRPLGSDAMN